MPEWLIKVGELLLVQNAVNSGFVADASTVYPAFAIKILLVKGESRSSKVNRPLASEECLARYSQNSTIMILTFGHKYEI